VSGNNDAKRHLAGTGNQRVGCLQGLGSPYGARLMTLFTSQRGAEHLT